MTVLDPVIGYLMTIYNMQGSRRVLSLNKIMNGAERPRKSVLRVLDKLTREGYLEQITDHREINRRLDPGPARRNPEWRIIRDLSDRPALPKASRNTLRNKIWKLIRAKRHFTKNTLVTASGASAGTVDEYVRMLERHGHIRRTGRDGRRVTYMLTTQQIERPVGMEKGGSHE